ncbi:hypothetical protein [Aneurinibacillus aneurinilyticus]|uniref:hypothetical protein n=1 Tax=Aneurinibacillus aneurinilyticus TaxID=1391 RepID=UPI00367281E1
MNGLTKTNEKETIIISNLTNRSAAQALRRQISEAAEAQRGYEMVSDFLAMMDRWHGSAEVWDDTLEAEILEQQAYAIRKLKVFPPRGTTYFSPSSANSCKREMYVKLTGATRDNSDSQPHQGRWQRAGTAFGDTIQRDLLFIEKHYEKKFGEKSPFVPERTPQGFPMWERFARKFHSVEHRGYTVNFLGQPDGILRYKDGTRVGLEIKSKQTTSAQTTEYSMRGPKEDHVKQCVVYSIMYGVDDYLIVYGNLSKKAWVMTPEEYAKNPDLRAFHICITESDRQALLDTFADVLQAVKDGNPPPLELDKFTFNNYKTACALSLTDAELEDIRKQVRQVGRSRLPDWKKQTYYDALDFIERVRKEEV